MNTVDLYMALALVLTSTSCATPQVSFEGVTMTEGDAAQALLAQAQALESEGRQASAIVRYEKVIERFGTTDAAAISLMRLGDLGMQAGGCAEARPYYEAFLSEFGGHTAAPALQQSLDACSGVVSDAQKDEFERFESEEAKADYAAGQAEQAMAEGQPVAAFGWLVKVHASLSEDARGPVETQIVELVESHLAHADMLMLLEEYPERPFVAETLHYALGRLQHHLRDFVRSAETLRRLLAEWPESRYAAGTRELLGRADARAKVKPKTIGVLLPLSGKLEGYGRNVAQAVRLAAGEFDSGDTPVNIVVRDSKGSPVETAQAIEDFVMVDHAIAVVGALFRVEAEAAAAQAQELGIPLLTVSAAKGVTRFGPYIFRSGLTPEAEMGALVDYVMDVHGMQTFGILYPRHPYGRTMMNLFWDRVEAKGGQIRALESYGPMDTTFTWPVKHMVGRAALDLRSDYRQGLNECKLIKDSYRRGRCTRDLVRNLPPVIDFDGLFIPDYPRTLALIAPALAFEDIIVETNARRLRKIEKTLGRRVRPVRLLGASGWNSKRLPEKAERYVENAVFTDGFYAGGRDKETSAFVSAFQKHFKRTPRLPEALFYDATRIVRQVVETRAPADRNAMRDALADVSGFRGVTGTTTFRGRRDAKKTIRLLTIKDSLIVEAPEAVEVGKKK